MYVRGVGNIGRGRGLGQAVQCSSAYSPGNCAAVPGAVYDDDNEVCNCPAGSAPTAASTAITPAAANNCANNANPGTFWDVNCPAYCIVGGTGLFGGNDCWPCSNVCPSGTNFDTTNSVCSATPATTNCKSGVPGVPNPFANIPVWVWAAGIGIVALMVIKK
jgi:hypothetical protein